MNFENKKKAKSATFQNVTLSHQAEFTGSEWKEGLVAGNGKSGVVLAGSPDEEVYIFQNMDFIMPTPHPRHTPEDLREQLHQARQSVLNWDDSWDGNGRKRTYMYPFHPGEQLRLRFPEGRMASMGTKVSDREGVLGIRSTNYATNEIKVTFENKSGSWQRSTFVSCEDDVVVTDLQQSDEGVGISVDISIDNLSGLPKFGKWKHGTAPELSMKYCKFADADRGIIGILAHYPVFAESELAESGYLVLTKLVQVGGSCTEVAEAVRQEEICLGESPVLQIRDAQELYLLTRAVRIEHLGTMEDFCGDGRKVILEEILAAYEQQLQVLIDKYSAQKGSFSYKEALAASVRRKQALFGEVSLWLGRSEQDTAEAVEEDYGKALSNEELLQKQKASEVLLPEMIMAAYAQGRYALESSAGYAVPRLCGLWTGEFNPGWAGAYTMDANVNIQVSGMNVGNLYGAGLGYIYFVLRQLGDWKQNAKDVYGMEDAILIPVNTDGSRAMMVECDKNYPFQYWNAGAAWMMVPLYEFWQCFGNGEIPLTPELQIVYQKEALDLVQEILRPLLHMTMNFWQQLCTPEYFVDGEGKAQYCGGKTALEQGERYLMIPSYSPENKPIGYSSSITANAAMDISAARDCMSMVIHLEEHIGDANSQAIINSCRALLADLPEYLFDETGALREWALEEFKDNNEHRHISHLYCAWPAYETQGNESLRSACAQAIKNREEANRGKDDASSHGWIHRALVAARLKDGEGAGEILRLIFTSDIFYSTLMTDHDITKARGVYCTDTAIGLVGVIQEMLLYSDEEWIEFLPAAAPEWTVGSICGLRTRNGVLIKELFWNVKEKKLRAVLEARENVQVNISWRGMEGSFCNEKGERTANGSRMVLNKGEHVLTFDA